MLRYALDTNLCTFKRRKGRRLIFCRTTDDA